MEKDRSMSTEQPTKLSDLFTQLLTFTEGLTDKINLIKEKQQADFIVAYKNHMHKIKKDLQELKQKSEDQERLLQQNDRVTENERKLTWFREESIKLYQKLEGKNKENYELRFKIQELQSEKEFLESQTKQLMKRNRQLEVHVYNEIIPAESKQVMDQTFCTTTPLTQIKKAPRKYTESKLETQTSSHLPAIREIIERTQLPMIDKIQSIDDVINYIQNVDNKHRKQVQSLKYKINQLLSTNTKANIIKSDLENFFLECVETVRREIMKRKSLNQQQQQMQKYISTISNFDVFHKEDKQKILELVLSHEKLLVFIYQKIFPNQFTTMLQSLKEDTNIEFVTNQTFQLKSDNNTNRIEFPKTTRDVRSQSHQQQLEVKKGKLLFKAY